MTTATATLPLELGILGTGRMGTRLAAMFARAGRRVVLGSRDPDRARAAVDALATPGVVAGDYATAAAAPAVLPAVFLRDGLEEVLEGVRPMLAGKLLVDISNPFNADYSDYTLPWDDSSAERLQRRFPEASVSERSSTSTPRSSTPRASTAGKATCWWLATTPAPSASS
jgi:predicted dinucleotide-binding enzyme